MKTRLLTLVLIAATLVLAGIPCSPAEAASGVTIQFLNPPPDGLLTLTVGEPYTFEVEVTSDDPFVLAAAQTDAFYPGRGVFWHGGDRTTHAESATLELTITGKSSTAGLPQVCGWPEPDTPCWPEGTAPVSIVAGARFKGGVTIAEVFAFAVRVVD
jgi:hypothetical protein